MPGITFSYNFESFKARLIFQAKQNPGCGERWGILSTYFEKSLKQHTLGLNKAQLYAIKIFNGKHLPLIL